MTSSSLLALAALALLPLEVEAVSAPFPTQPPQKSMSAQTTQAQLEDRIKKLEADLAEEKLKLAAAAIEKDYIERTQKDAKDYYDKVLDHQTKWLYVMAAIITLIPGFAALFSFRVFDRRIQSATDAAVATLEKNFSEKMQTELETLREQNSQRIAEETRKLDARSRAFFYYSQALTSWTIHEYHPSQESFRKALAIYVKHHAAFEREFGASIVQGVFGVISSQAPEFFEQNAANELENDLYKGLQSELAFAALHMPKLATVLRNRKDTATATPTVPSNQDPKKPA